MTKISFLEFKRRLNAGQKDFTGYDFAGFCFDGLNLGGVNLTRCDLYDASFKRANCRYARLDRADCRYASFEGADCRYASFVGADCRETVGLFDRFHAILPDAYVLLARDSQKDRSGNCSDGTEVFLTYYQLPEELEFKVLKAHPQFEEMLKNPYFRHQLDWCAK